MRTRNQIAQEIALKHGITIAELKLPVYRGDKLSPIKQEAIWTMTQEKKEDGTFSWSYRAIALWFKCDHTSILYARKTYAKRMGIPLVQRNKA